MNAYVSVMPLFIFYFVKIVFVKQESKLVT